MMHVESHRTGSVISREKCEFLIIDNATFNSLISHHHLHFEPELARRVLEIEPDNRSMSDVNILKNLLSTISFFSELPSAMVLALCGVIELRSYLKNDQIIQKGDVADGMFVVLSGKISIHHETRGIRDEGQDGGIVGKNGGVGRGTTARKKVLRHRRTMIANEINEDEEDGNDKCDNKSGHGHKHWSLLHHTMQTVAKIKQAKQKSKNKSNDGNEGANEDGNDGETKEDKESQLKINFVRPSISIGLHGTPKDVLNESDKIHSKIDSDPTFVSVASMGDVIGERCLLTHSGIHNVDLKVLSERKSVMCIATYHSSCFSWFFLTPLTFLAIFKPQLLF